MTVFLLRATFPGKDEAIEVARVLLEERLVACVNIGDVSLAMYHWEDMLQREEEVVMIAKTTEKKIAQAMARIKSLHSYQIPSILSWQIDHADTAFATWVADAVA